MKTVAEPIGIRPTEPDLIDRIAGALPEEIRAEYYRELRHCRSLPENDEMLRLLRAMQFLVLLIEQAPARVAEERQRLDELLTAAVSNIGKVNAASETYHATLQRRLTGLPAEVATGISPGAIASHINENLREIFVRSTIPMTAEALGVIAERMKNVCSEFSVASDNLGNTYRGAAEEARMAVSSLNKEIAQASEKAARFTGELQEKFSRAHRWSLFMLASGALVVGLVLGMMFEKWLFFPPAAVVEAPTQVVQPVQQDAPPPTEKAPSAAKSRNQK